jgi:hypothetical protein
VILGDLARVVSRGGGLHPINRKRSCERAAEDVARFRDGRSHGCLSGFCQGEGSGQAGRRIPGAHEAIGEVIVDGSSTALKEAKSVGTLSCNVTD